MAYHLLPIVFTFKGRFQHQSNLGKKRGERAPHRSLDSRFAYFEDIHVRRDFGIQEIVLTLRRPADLPLTNR